jgi:uncharacterized protein YbjT (DUF2867 family)
VNSASGAAAQVLVVGGTGRVGGEVIRQLQADGIAVRALVRPHSRRRAALAGDIEIAEGDLGDRSSLDAAVTGVSAVFVAVSDHPRQAEWECSLIDAAESQGSLRLVKVSAFAASLEAPPGYGRIHAAVERRLARSTLRWTVLQPYMYMQNFLEMARPVRRAGRLPLPLGRSPVAFIDARDVSTAAACVLKKGGHGQRTYILTGSAALTGDDVAAAMSRSLQRRVRYLAVPQWLAGAMMRMDGVSRWDARMRAELFAMLRDGGEAPINDNYHQLTGLSPASLERFLHDHRPVFSGH